MINHLIKKNLIDYSGHKISGKRGHLREQLIDLEVDI